MSSQAQMEQAPLIPAKRKAEDVPMEDEATPGLAQVARAAAPPATGDATMEDILDTDEKTAPMPRSPSTAAAAKEARLKRPRSRTPEHVFPFNTTQFARCPARPS